MDICLEVFENCFVYVCGVKLFCICCGEGWFIEIGVDMIEIFLLYIFVMFLFDSI